MSTEISGAPPKVTYFDLLDRPIRDQSWLMRSTDTAGAAMSYSYDSAGNLLAMADPAGNTTRMTYDLRGRQLSLSVPGAGTTSFQYNAVGELMWQRNARGQETQLRYDALGRLIERQAPEGISRWVYDTEPKGIGKLASVQGPDGFQEASSYDTLGRPAQTTTTIDGSAFTIALSYDSAGRVAAHRYPNATPGVVGGVNNLSLVDQTLGTIPARGSVARMPHLVVGDRPTMQRIINRIYASGNRLATTCRNAAARASGRAAGVGAASPVAG